MEGREEVLTGREKIGGRAQAGGWHGAVLDGDLHVDAAGVGQGLGDLVLHILEGLRRMALHMEQEKEIIINASTKNWKGEKEKKKKKEGGGGGGGWLKT